MNSEGPGIEGFQIIGDATPGEKLLGCGFPVRGTTLCMFQVKFLDFIHVKIFSYGLIFHVLTMLFALQWVRHLHDGTRQYIEGEHKMNVTF